MRFSHHFFPPLFCKFPDFYPPRFSHQFYCQVGKNPDKFGEKKTLRRNLRAIRTFYMMCRFLHRVFTIYSIVKRAIFSRRIRYFPFTSLSSLSHPLSRITGAYIDLQGVAPGVDPCIIFAGIYNCWAHRSKSKYTAHCNLGLKLTTRWCLVLAATLKHFIWFTPPPTQFLHQF